MSCYCVISYLKLSKKKVVEILRYFAIIKRLQNYDLFSVKIRYQQYTLKNLHERHLPFSIR